MGKMVNTVESHYVNKCPNINKGSANHMEDDQQKENALFIQEVRSYAALDIC